MNRFPIPHLIINSIYDISPEKLKELKIDFLLIDLDNTLSPYSIKKPLPKLIRWAEEIRNAGIELFILSNSHSDRPRIFADALDIGYVKSAGKPFTRKARGILAQKGVSPEKAAIIGDQIYTDVLCARMLGMTAIAVRPISMRNPLLALRYILETPFRLAYRMKNSDG